MASNNKEFTYSLETDPLVMVMLNEGHSCKVDTPTGKLHLFSNERIPKLCRKVLEGKLQTLSFQNIAMAGSEEQTMRLNTFLYNDQRNVHDLILSGL